MDPKRVKEPRGCSMCGQPGHNKRTHDKAVANQSSNSEPVFVSTGQHKCSICGDKGHNKRGHDKAVGIINGVGEPVVDDEKSAKISALLEKIVEEKGKLERAKEREAPRLQRAADKRDKAIAEVEKNYQIDVMQITHHSLCVQERIKRLEADLAAAEADLVQVAGAELVEYSRVAPVAAPPTTVTPAPDPPLAAAPVEEDDEDVLKAFVAAVRDPTILAVARDLLRHPTMLTQDPTPTTIEEVLIMALYKGLEDLNLNAHSWDERHGPPNPPVTGVVH
jgi:hypothetical protein